MEAHTYSTAYVETYVPNIKLLYNNITMNLHTQVFLVQTPMFPFNYKNIQLVWMQDRKRAKRGVVAERDKIK